MPPGSAIVVEEDLMEEKWEILRGSFGEVRKEGGEVRSERDEIGEKRVMAFDDDDDDVGLEAVVE
jgi:hypothetical protein